MARLGPQGWWPVARRPGLPAVYSRHWTRGALTAAQKWEVALGAVLTQNTAWTNVERALARLRAARVFHPREILGARAAFLAALLRPSGTFRQKARRLRVLARHVERRGGLLPLLRQPTAAARAELLSLPGVGPETADSVLLYAGGHPVFVVDAYTRRLAHRLGLFEYNRADMVQAHIHRRLRPDVPRWREFHALIVAHAKVHCRAVPACDGCPLISRCPTGGARG